MTPPDLSDTQWLKDLAPLAVLFTSVGAVLAQFLSSFFARKTTESQQMRAQLTRRVPALEQRLDTERRTCDETIDKKDRVIDALRTESDRMKENYDRRLDEKQRRIDELEVMIRAKPHGGS